VIYLTHYNLSRELWCGCGARAVIEYRYAPVMSLRPRWFHQVMCVRDSCGHTSAPYGSLRRAVDEWLSVHPQPQEAAL